MKTITAFLAGLIFGLGLIVAGMVNPAKVLGFLDIAGNWDPSLAFVMAGAIGVGSIAFGIAARKPVTALGDPIRIPNNKTIDGKLIGGSLLFGIGWGLVGICPGPSFVLIGLGEARALIFVAAMLAGLAVANVIGGARNES